jgi:hypothetical protein
MRWRGGRNFDPGAEERRLCARDRARHDVSYGPNSGLRAGVTRSPRRANNGSRAVSNRQGLMIIARVIEVARLSLWPRESCYG